MALDQELIEALEEAAAAASAWHEISTPLRSFSESADDPSRVLAAAFDYMLRVDRFQKHDRDARVFEPMFRFADGRAVPPDIEDVTEAWLDVWSDASTRVSHPAASSRLHDLLLVARRDVPTNAKEAVRGYLELSGSSWSALDRSDALLRANEISLQFNIASARAEISEQMVLAARSSLEGSDSAPGVALPLLRALAQQQDCPPEVDELLALARRTYVGAHHVESIVEIQKVRARGDHTRREELDRDRVMAWLDEARAAEGLVKVVHLETAARIARDAGLSDLQDVAQRELQAIPKEDLELEHITAEVPIPEDVVDEYLAPFTGAESVHDALVALISHPPATGNASQNREALERSRREFPLQYLFPRVQLGGDGLPRFRANSDEELEDSDLAHQELLHLQVVGELLARGLFLAGESLRPTSEDVESFLGSLPNKVDGVPQLLARSLAAYWREDWTDALFLALPCVEALARQLVLATGRGIYETQRGQRPGQYPGLRALLRWMLETGFDESWYRYAWTVLANPAGLNLRNEVAHGFVRRTGPLHAAVVIHIAVFLAALHLVEAEPSGASDSASA